MAGTPAHWRTLAVLCLGTFVLDSTIVNVALPGLITGLHASLCGAVHAPLELAGARVLQGIGAAALTPQALVIIQSVFPRERMGTALGVFSSMVGRLTMTADGCAGASPARAAC